MGKLIRFDKKGRPISTQSTQNGSGEVVIFTGVRYERMPEGFAQKKDANSKRKRKRI